MELLINYLRFSIHCWKWK